MKIFVIGSGLNLSESLLYMLKVCVVIFRNSMQYCSELIFECKIKNLL